MAEIDEKDAQAFTELQNKLIELSEKQKLTQQQHHLANQTLKRAVLTATELQRLEDDTPTYETAGKAYFLKPRAQLLQNLQEQATACSAEIKVMKETQETLQRAMKGKQEEIQELINNSPGFARAVGPVGQA